MALTISANAQGRVGKLEIAYSPALEIRVIPRVFRRFRRRYPAVPNADVHYVGSAPIESRLALRRVSPISRIPYKLKGLAPL